MLAAGAQLLKSIAGAGLKTATGGIGKAWIGAGLETASLGGFAWGATKSIVAGGGRNKASMFKSGLWGGAKWGTGVGLEEMADSPWGQEQSGAMRALLHVGSFGFKAGAVRSAARGVVGSGLSAAGRASGDPSRFFRATRSPADLRGILQYPRGTAQYNAATQKMTGSSWYDALVTQKLGGVFKGGNYGLWERGVGGRKGHSPFMGGTGSLFGLAAQGGLSLGGGVAKAALRMPVQMAVGIGPAAWAGTRFAAKGARQVIGGAAHLVGAGAWGRGVMKGGASFSDIVSPQFLGGKIGWAQKAGQGSGVIGREGYSPIMAGTFALAGAGTLKYRGGEYDQGRRRGNRGMSPVSMNPRHFQGGMRANMRGPFKNYGPALTLAIHNNHSRVMP